MLTAKHRDTNKRMTAATSWGFDNETSEPTGERDSRVARKSGIAEKESDGDARRGKGVLGGVGSSHHVQYPTAYFYLQRKKC